MTSTSYIHGVGDRKTEQDRLKLQASLMAQHLWQEIDLSSLTGPKPFLELGCGVGAQTPDLLNKLPLGTRVIGIDHDPHQISKAFENMDLYPNWKNYYDFQLMDGTQLEFETGSFKGAYICWVLEHMTKDQVFKTLSELRRVVEKNGFILINETDATPLSSVRFTTLNGNDFPPKALKFFHEMLNLQQEGGGNGSFGAKETMCSAVQKAGFKDYQYKRIVIDTAYPDPIRSNLNIGTLKLLESTLPALVKKNRFTEEEFQQVRQEITISPLFHWEGGQILIRN